MNVIKTPTGTFTVDDAAKVLTQAQYNALSTAQKNSGTYFITDASGKALADIVGVSDFSGVAGTVSEALVKLNNNINNKQTYSLRVSGNKLVSTTNTGVVKDSIIMDKSLTLTDCAADAKATGTRLDAIKLVTSYNASSKTLSINLQK